MFTFLYICLPSVCFMEGKYILLSYWPVLSLRLEKEQNPDFSSDEIVVQFLPKSTEEESYSDEMTHIEEG